MAELAEVALEQAADVLEEVADAAEHAAEISRGLSSREVKLVVVGSMIGLAGGAAGGGWFIDRRLRTKYEKIAEEEIDAMREHFRSRLVAKEVKPELSDLGRKVETLGYATPTGPPPAEVEIEEEVEVHNVFAEAWDIDSETAARAGKKSYVIHTDERHEAGFTETTLTYYEGDDVLCDAQDKVVEDQELVVGVENLDRFGVGSNDPNVVYIRNIELGMEIEVVRSERTYAEDVHGMTHSDPPREGRIRWDE